MTTAGCGQECVLLGYTLACGEASAPAPVPLRLRGQAQFFFFFFFFFFFLEGGTSATLLYLSGGGGAHTLIHTHIYTHTQRTVPTHTHTHTHTYIHRAADRQHDFTLHSAFSARYDGGEPAARSRRQNVSYSLFFSSRTPPEKQLSDVEM